MNFLHYENYEGLKSVYGRKNFHRLTQLYTLNI